MKCVIDKSGKISRLRDEQAHALVKNGGVKYCPKKLWKEQRDERVS